MPYPFAIVKFLAREYSRLSNRLRLLTELVEKDADKRIIAVVLFGSIARLTASPSSDTDLLVLMETSGNRALERELSHHFYRLLTSAETANGEDGSLWHIVLVTGNATGDDLDADFLSQVGQDGVLMYQRSGSTLPVVLQNMASFADWQERAQLLATVLSRTLDLYNKEYQQSIGKAS